MARGKRAEKNEEKNGEAPGPGHNVGTLDDDQLQALTWQHKKAYQAALAVKKDGDAKFKNACKLAKAELGDGAVDDIKTLIELETEEGETKISDRVQHMLRVARWAGSKIGTQFEIFDEDRTPAVDRAASEGRRDGLAGDPCKPSYDPSTPQYKSYMDAFHEGQAVLAKGIRAPTPVEAAAAAAKAGDEHIARVSEKLGTAPATFTQQ